MSGSTNESPQSSERLHAPHLDLVELDACVNRLTQVLRILVNAAPSRMGDVSTSGVAPTRVVDSYPGLPLLNQQILRLPRVGRMEPRGSWNLGTSEQRRHAVATLVLECSPLLGKVTIAERVRSDLSNAPAAADPNAHDRIVSSIRRLRDLVAFHADALRRVMAGDATAVVDAARDDLVAACTPHLAAVAAELPEHARIDELSIRSGGAYPGFDILMIDDDRQTAGRVLSKEALDHLAVLTSTVVELDVRHHAGGVVYDFSPAVVSARLPEPPSDAMDRLRFERDLAGVPLPAWSGRDLDDF